MHIWAKQKMLKQKWTDTKMTPSFYDFAILQCKKSVDKIKFSAVILAFHSRLFKATKTTESIKKVEQSTKKGH